MHSVLASFNGYRGFFTVIIKGVCIFQQISRKSAPTNVVSAGKPSPRKLTPCNMRDCTLEKHPYSVAFARTDLQHMLDGGGMKRCIRKNPAVPLSFVMDQENSVVAFPRKPLSMNHIWRNMNEPTLGKHLYNAVFAPKNSAILVHI